MNLKMNAAKNKKLNLPDKLILFLNCTFSILLLLSYLSSSTDPQRFWVIALLGLYFLLLLFINLLFVLYWLIRKKIFALISILCILLGIKVLMMNFDFRFPNPAEKKRLPEYIRTIAFNVHGFTRIGALDGVPDKTEIINLLNDFKPDVFSIEEFSVNMFNHKEIFAGLKKVVHSDNYYFKSYEVASWDTSGLAIFSRYPIVNRGSVTPVNSDIEAQNIFADIKYGNEVIRVYCLHLQSTGFAAEDHQYLKSLRESGKVSLHNLKRINGKLKMAFIKRSMEVSLIKQNMAKCPYPYIVQGDFNDTPSSFSVSQIGKGLKSAFMEKGSGFGFTYYGDFPNFQIDYILTSSQFSVIDYKVITKKLSDHYPVMSDLYLRKK
jgi:endonuclease/exonuclease/phosphatase family metal-dependent hydrolase